VRRFRRHVKPEPRSGIELLTVGGEPHPAREVWEGKTQSGEIGDPVTMLELISLLRTLARLFRDRRDLMVENLLLRHQLHVALRSHPRPDLKTRDRLWGGKSPSARTRSTFALLHPFEEHFTGSVDPGAHFGTVGEAAFLVQVLGLTPSACAALVGK
jgi:hypothetical protein